MELVVGHQVWPTALLQISLAAATVSEARMTPERTDP